MSFSEISTLRPSSMDDYQPLDGYAYGNGALAVNPYTRSPYTDTDLFALEVGSNKTRFRVHRTVLSQSTELEVKSSNKLWGESSTGSLLLPELDEATAHTLVHYLYTGTYQTLRESFDGVVGGGRGDDELDQKPYCLPAYQLATCVYSTAMRYKLPGLAELSKAKIVSYAESLTIVDILTVAREHVFPNLPDSEAWYAGYLENAIKLSVTRDPDLFTRPEFIDQIEGDRRFRQVVMSAVVKYSGGLHERRTSVSTPLTESRLEDGTESRSEIRPVSAEQNTVVPRTTDINDHIAPVDAGHIPPQEPPAAASAEVVHAQSTEATHSATLERDKTMESMGAYAFPRGQDKEEPLGSESLDLKLDEIEPAQPMPVEPEPFTDELGFATSKTYQRMGKKEDSPPINDTVTATGKATPTHKRTDSAVGSEETGAMETPPMPVEDKAATEQISDAAMKGPMGGKKGKKKKKKLAAAAAAATT